VHDWLAARGAAWTTSSVAFYSDSTNDLPLLELRQRPGGHQPRTRRSSASRASAAGLRPSTDSHDQKFIQQTARPLRPDAAHGRATEPAKKRRRCQRAIPLGVRTEVPREQHGIDPKLLDANAVRVVTTLRRPAMRPTSWAARCATCWWAMRPKDFDVATDATPEQVKALFRRAFIIGRRFRIVHVVFGRGREHEVIEVSTFRAYLDNAAAEQVEGNEKTSQERTGRQEATWWTPAAACCATTSGGRRIEDAARRDFTINAMYYDPLTQIVVDYHGGLADVRAAPAAHDRRPRDPLPRRSGAHHPRGALCRQAGLRARGRDRKPILRMSDLLANVPASRLFDEMIKLLQTGHALASIEQLKRRQGRTAACSRSWMRCWTMRTATTVGRSSSTRRWPTPTAASTKARRWLPASCSPACSGTTWSSAATSCARTANSPFPALLQAIDQVFDARIGDISGRGKLAADMREIWTMQPRFERRTPNAAESLLAQPRFRAGFDFLRLRADAARSRPNWPTGGRTITSATTTTVRRLCRTCARPRHNAADDADDTPQRSPGGAEGGGSGARAAQAPPAPPQARWRRWCNWQRCGRRRAALRAA
jgi:poly(A) polymerase